MREMLQRYIDEQARESTPIPPQPSPSSALPTTTEPPLGQGEDSADLPSGRPSPNPPRNPSLGSRGTGSRREPSAPIPTVTPPTGPISQAAQMKRPNPPPTPLPTPRPRLHRPRPSQPAPGSYAAVYLTITDFADNGAMRLPTARALHRDCSLVIQPNPAVEKYSTYHLHWRRGPPQHSSQWQLYHMHDLPDPRRAEPGLLAMNFVTWIPRRWLPYLDIEIRQVDIRRLAVTESPLWARMCLWRMFKVKMLSQVALDAAVAQQECDLRIDSCANFPNWVE